jgi:hypothetical protein
MLRFLFHKPSLARRIRAENLYRKVKNHESPE